MHSRPKKGNRRKASPALGRQRLHSYICKVVATLWFFLPPKYTPLSRDIFQRWRNVLNLSLHPHKKKGGGSGGGGGDSRPLRYTRLQPSLSCLSTPSQPLPILPLLPPKSLTTAKETKKKFSCPSPGGRSASLLFAANPQSSWRHPEPRPIGERSAAAARGGWGESDRSLLPGARGLAGGGRGPSHINPSSRVSAARAGCALQGGRRGSPRRERGRGDLQPQLLSSSPSPLSLYPSPSPSSSPYLLGGVGP